jgi:hypothetical protein
MIMDVFTTSMIIIFFPYFSQGNRPPLRIGFLEGMMLDLKGY